MKNYFLLVLSSALWGLTYITTKSGEQALSASAFMFWRYLLGVIFILLLLRKAVFAVPWREQLVGLGLIGLPQFFSASTFAIGILYTSPAKSAFLFSLNCGIVPLLIWIHQRKAPSKNEWLAILLCLLGGILITNPFSMYFHWADMLMVVAVIFSGYWFLGVSLILPPLKGVGFLWL